MSWSDFPFARPIATVMLLVGLTVLGVVSLALLPRDMMPVVTEPEIDVDVPFPGSHPLEALNEVVRPIEAEVATIPGVKAIFGFVRPGSAQIEVQFDWSADIALKTMEVREAVDRVRDELPASIGHIGVEADTGGPGAEILNGRISATRNLSESWELLDRRIRQPLERIRGVANVRLYGVEPQEVRVDLDLAALDGHDIAVGELIAEINAANLDLDLGSIRGDILAYDVRSSARFRDIDTVRDLPIGRNALRLSDVATVSLREPVLDYGRHLNRNFAIGFDVFKEPQANAVDTVARLEKRIDAIRNDPELAGIDVLVWENAGETILTSLYGLRNAGIVGGILAITVLGLFLRRVSTTLIVGAAIPFSLLVTCAGIYLLGKSLNVLSMLGLMLGVGMLVDNAVVVIENIYRLQARGVPPREAARLGTRQVARAIVAATATTVIVWSWLFISEPSTMIVYTGEVATVICLSVVCSLLISLTFIPLAAARFVPDRKLREGLFVRRLVPAYRTLLSWTLSRPLHRALTLAGLALLAGSAAIPFQLLEKTDDPEMQQKDVLIHYEIHDPSTKEVLEAHVNIVEDWLEGRRAELGYESVYSYYGREWGAGTRVYLDLKDATKKNIEELRARLEDDLPVIPGVSLEIGNHRQRHRGPTRDATVRVAVRGEDPEFLESLAIQVETRVRNLPHVKEVYGPSLVGNKEIRVHVDPERARAFDVSPQRVADAVSFTFRGQRLRRYLGPHGEIEIVAGLPEFAQPGLGALEDLNIPTEDGRSIALGSVADMQTARTPPNIQRVDRRTTSWVVVEFDPEETTTQDAKDHVELALAGLSFPDGYSWDWGQEMRREDEGLRVMLYGVYMSLAAVVLLMAGLFESLSQTLAILITLPLALFGAFWALWIFGFTLDVLAVIGVIILIGLVVNNGIVMVVHVNDLRREGQPRIEALVTGCGDRLRPVLMTAITTVAGLVPLAMSPLIRSVAMSTFGIEVSQFTVAGVYIESMAVALMGGLISSTIFTLIALPVWYSTIEDLGALLLGLFRGLSFGRLRPPRGGILVGSARRLE